MSMQEKESVAALRVLVAVAKVDGRPQDEERKALQAALANVKLPPEVTIDKLMQERTDVKAELGKLQAPEDKEALFRAAYSMVHADGQPTEEGKRLLDEIRTSLGIRQEEASFASKVVKEATETLVPGTIEPISDPQRREKAVDSDVLKYSTIAAVLGAFPIPVADLAVNIAVVGVQTKMFHDLGRYFGFTSTKEQIKNLMAGIGVGTGARVAIVSIAKFIPGWGSVVGAVTNFAATWALGKVAKRYYESGGKADARTLKEVFDSAEKEGRAVYDREKKTIETKAEAAKGRVTTLATDLKEGKITQEQYQKELAEIA
jgi:uncharacterized protein (DUF697 family)/tellurite resistance protein